MVNANLDERRKEAMSLDGSLVNGVRLNVFEVKRGARHRTVFPICSESSPRGVSLEVYLNPDYDDPSSARTSDWAVVVGFSPQDDSMQARRMVRQARGYLARQGFVIHEPREDTRAKQPGLYENIFFRKPTRLMASGLL